MKNMNAFLTNRPSRARGAGLFTSALVVTFALAGCTSPAADTSTDDSAGAGRFASCLAAGGVPAKAVEPGYVVVRVAGPGQNVAPDDTSTGALLTLSDDEGTWVAPAGADFFTDDAEKRERYAECANQHPGFTQPVAQAPTNGTGASDGLAEALEFTRCARDAGFTWMADPDPSTGASIVLPPSLTESDFRALLTACSPFSGGGGLGWSVAGDLAFDWMSVLEEFATVAASTDPAAGASS